MKATTAAIFLACFIESVFAFQFAKTTGNFHFENRIFDQGVHQVLRRHDTSSLSPCVTNCFLNVFPEYHCNNLTQCVCENVALQSALANCTLVSHCSIPDLLASEKVQARMCNKPIRNKTEIFVIAQSALLSVAVISIFLRIINRGKWVGGAGYGWDDWTFFAACLPMLGLTVTGYLESGTGLGQDIWELSIDEIEMVLMLFYIGNTFYAPVVFGTKIAFVLLYLRIWRGSSAVFLGLCWVVISLLVIALIGFEFSTIFLCTPIDFAWRAIEGAHGQCIHRNEQLYTNSCVNIAMDLVVLLLPVPKIWRLGMNWPKKIGLMSTFLVGFAVTAVSATQLYFLIQRVSNTRNPTWDYFPIALWRVVEIYLSVICCCMPMMTGLGKRFFRRLGDTISMHSSLGEGKLKGLSSNGKNSGKGVTKGDRQDSVLQLNAKPSGTSLSEGLERGWQNEHNKSMEREQSSSRSKSEDEEDPGENKRHTRSGDEQRKAAESMLYGSARSEAQPFGDIISPDQAQHYEGVTPLEPHVEEDEEQEQKKSSDRPRKSRDNDSGGTKRPDTSSKAYTALPFVFGDGPALQLNDPSAGQKDKHHLLTPPDNRHNGSGRSVNQDKPLPPQPDRHHILTPPDNDLGDKDLPEDEQARRMASSASTLRPPPRNGKAQNDSLPVPYSPSIYDSWDTTPASDFDGMSMPSAAREEPPDEESAAIPNDVRTLPSQGGSNRYAQYQRGVVEGEGRTSRDTPFAELWAGPPSSKRTSYFSGAKKADSPREWNRGPPISASEPTSPRVTTRKMWHPDGQRDPSPPGSPRNFKPYDLGQRALSSTPPPQSPTFAPGMGNAVDDDSAKPSQINGRQRNSSIASSDYPSHQYVRGNDGTWDLAQRSDYPEPKSHPHMKDERNGDGQRSRQDDAPVRPKAPTPANIPTTAEYMAQLLRSDSDHIPQWEPGGPSPRMEHPPRRPAPAPIQFLEFSGSRFDDANRENPDREQVSLWQGDRTSSFGDHQQRRRVADAERQLSKEGPVYPVSPPPDLPEQQQRNLHIAMDRMVSDPEMYDVRHQNRYDQWDDRPRHHRDDWNHDYRRWDGGEDEWPRGRRFDGPVSPPSSDNEYWEPSRRRDVEQFNARRSAEVSPEDSWNRKIETPIEDRWNRRIEERYSNRSQQRRSLERAYDDRWLPRNNGERYARRSAERSIDRWSPRNGESFGRRSGERSIDRWGSRNGRRWRNRSAGSSVDHWSPRYAERFGNRAADTPLEDRWQNRHGDWNNNRWGPETPMDDHWQRRNNWRSSAGSWQEAYNKYRRQPETPQWNNYNDNARYHTNNTSRNEFNKYDDEDNYSPWKPSAALQKSLEEYSRKSMAEWKLNAEREQRQQKPKRSATTASNNHNHNHNHYHGYGRSRNVSNASAEEYLPAHFKQPPSQQDYDRQRDQPVRHHHFVPPASQAEADKTSHGYVPRALRSEKEPVTGWQALDLKGWDERQDEKQQAQGKGLNMPAEIGANAWAPVEMRR